MHRCRYTAASVDGPALPLRRLPSLPPRLTLLLPLLTLPLLQHPGPVLRPHKYIGSVAPPLPHIIKGLLQYARSLHVELLLDGGIVTLVPRIIFLAK